MTFIIYEYNYIIKNIRKKYSNFKYFIINVFNNDYGEGWGEIVEVKNIPNTLYKLNACVHDECFKISNLQKKIRSLLIHSNWNKRIAKIENLPSKLHTLTITNCANYIKIENLPFELHTLKLSYHVNKIENLPFELNTLNINCEKITKIENIPDKLRVLILNCEVSKIENIPNDLKTLIIDKYNTIEKIENIPINLKTLIIKGENKIQNIENLPNNLKILQIKPNYIIRNIIFPDNLRELYLYGIILDKIKEINFPKKIKISLFYKLYPLFRHTQKILRSTTRDMTYNIERINNELSDNIKRNIKKLLYINVINITDMIKKNYLDYSNKFK